MLETFGDGIIPANETDGFLFWYQTALFLRIDLFTDVALQAIVKNILKMTCLTKVLCKETMSMAIFSNGKIHAIILR